MLRDVDLKNCSTPTTPITTLYANGEECFSQMKLKYNQMFFLQFPFFCSSTEQYDE